MLAGIQSESGSSSSSYKYIVYVTIVERVSDKASSLRGIRTSSGAFWNQDKDGMWNHKWASPASVRGTGGVDVVFSVAWVHCPAPQ